MIKKNDAITARKVDFSRWYTDLCLKAELMDYSSVKGFIIYRPYGYAIWENIQKYLDDEFKKTGHQNVYMPLLIPESLLKKEADHVLGFAPECAVVTKGGYENLEENLLIRPTSETLFCEHYAKVVKSYRDLPKKYNQWCSVVRWEKTTRPFLRGSEFLWQEGHTIHETEKEARKETLDMLEIYKNMAKDLLAIPMITGKKTEKEKFAGAIETYTMESLMQDGKVLQSGTSHYFGQGFAKAFNISFLDKENKQQYVYQTSWGASTRLIGATIMVHSDDNGLILPPKVAPIQVIIIPIKQEDDEVIKKTNQVKLALEKEGIRVSIDTSIKSPGFKFNEAEMKGIPLRIEIGPKDILNNKCVVVKRFDYQKKELPLNENLASEVSNLLDDIQAKMYQKAKDNLDSHIYEASSLDDLENKLKLGGFVKVAWCGDLKCEEEIKDKYQATTRCLCEDKKSKCICCGKKTTTQVYIGKAY